SASIISVSSLIFPPVGRAQSKVGLVLRLGCGSRPDEQIGWVRSVRLNNRRRGLRLESRMELAPMCNDYRLLTNAAQLFDGFSETRIKIRFPEGAPNIEAREDVKITDMGPMVRAVQGEPEAGDLVQRRWSWPGERGKPVYNFRSEGREFASGRCL